MLITYLYLALLYVLVLEELIIDLFVGKASHLSDYMKFHRASPLLAFDSLR